MMKTLYSLFVMFLVCSFATREQAYQTGRLKVIVRGIKTTRGEIVVHVYSSSEGFPDEERKALRTGYAKIIDSKAEIVFADLKPGTYAVVAYHDENADKKMDTDWMGIPKEGVGVSNNAKGSMGPPKFNDAKFVFNQLEQTIVFSLIYL